MITKKKICKSCKNEAYIWSKSMCKLCFNKNKEQKPIKKSYLSKKPTEKALIKKEERKKWLEELHKWELDLFDKRKDKQGYCYCFETGTPMHESVYKMNLCIYSHCIPKNNHKELAMNEDNLLIVLPDIHALWEANPNNTPKMKEYTDKLKEKYGL